MGIHLIGVSDDPQIVADLDGAGRISVYPPVHGKEHQILDDPLPLGLLTCLPVLLGFRIPVPNSNLLSPLLDSPPARLGSLDLII